jgi:hypothetical protein
MFVKECFFSRAMFAGLRLLIRGKMNRRPRAKEIVFARRKRTPGFQDSNCQIIHSARALTTYFGMYMFTL